MALSIGRRNLPYSPYLTVKDKHGLTAPIRHILVSAILWRPPVRLGFFPVERGDLCCVTAAAVRAKGYEIWMVHHAFDESPVEFLRTHVFLKI
jgi:hypothetical protein